MSTIRHTKSAPRAVELVLPPRMGFARYLSISWRARLVTASAHVNQDMQPIAFAVGNPLEGHADPRGVHLYVSRNGSGALWVSGAAFDMSPEETDMVLSALLPLGLHVESDSVSTAQLDPRAVKESAPVVVPLDGRRGMSLASALGASALDLSNEIGYDG